MSDGGGTADTLDAASDATNDAGAPSCTTSIVDGDVSAAGPVAVGYDPAGGPHVVYVANSNADVRHAVRSAGTWSSRPLANTNGASHVAVSIVGGAPRIAVAQGNASVLVFDASVDGGTLVNAVLLDEGSSASQWSVTTSLAEVYGADLALRPSDAGRAIVLRRKGATSNEIALVECP